MKTEKFSILSDDTINSGDQVKTVFSPRKPLHHVEINVHRDATDSVKTAKDSLLGRKMAKARKRMKESSVQTEQTKTDAVTTVADLTGDVPSEAYWKKLAESKSKALDDALEVNRILSERLNELQEEMKVKDEMLDEARAMADVIKELVASSNTD